MSDAVAQPARIRCAGCGTEVAPSLLACPACHALVHRERLAAIAAEAAAADKRRAIELWREALSLLPAGSRQHDTVAERIDALNAELEAEEIKTRAASAKWLGPLGILIFALATKGKLLLLGFTKFGTVASMLLSLGVYWKLWGWKLAAALIGSIYIHEIGHVAALRRRGMAAGAPMFIPGLGAFVRMHQHAATPSEDAQVGLAGPRWGLGAALVALALWLYTGSEFWAVVAKLTAFINLFNLTPVWQLDGSRGFHALSRQQRWIAIVALAIAFAITRERMLVLVGAVAIWRAFEKRITRTGDVRALVEYTLLAAAFAAFAFVPAPL